MGTVLVSDIVNRLAQPIHALTNAGVLLKDAAALLARDTSARRNLAAYLRAGCPEFREQTVPPEGNHDYAETVLGGDFIPCERISQVCGIPYNDEIIRHFLDTFPSGRILERLRDDGFILMAGPPKALSLLDICHMDERLFHELSGEWGACDETHFSRKKEVYPGWIAIRKGVVPGSSSRHLAGQLLLISDVERVPTVGEATWAEFVYRKVCGEWLYPNVYVRTSSVGTDGSGCVYVGNSASGGIFHGCCPREHASPYLGLVSVWDL